MPRRVLRAEAVEDKDACEDWRDGVSHEQKGDGAHPSTAGTVEHDQARFRAM